MTHLRLRAIPHKDSADRRIVQTSKGEDIGRIEGGSIVYPKDVARHIVRAVNGEENLLKDLDVAEQELARRNAKLSQLKPIDLRAISRNSDRVFTHIRFEDYDITKVLTTTTEEPGVATVSDGVWLKFGECLIHNEGKSCHIGGRMADGIRDFEHDTPYIARIELLGLRYSFTNGHVSYFEANLTTDPDDIRIYPESFDPKAVKESWVCTTCERHHRMLPDGYFTPPVYDLAHCVAGKRVSIVFGPRWDEE